LPSDSNGVYSLPSGYEAVTGETIQASQHNPPLEDLASAMSARMMRSGVSPMTGALKIVDGSSGTPSVQFSNAASTGFYKTTSGIGVSIAGVKVAEFGAGGLVSGSRWIGELVPFTGYTAPALTVFPYGQTLSRAAYADLWAFAQSEIASGNTFYNNGNGSTTFGIGDLRGRVPVSIDNLGGPAAGRTTTTTMASATIGGTGGTQTVAIAQNQLPNIAPAASTVIGPSTVTIPKSAIGGSAGGTVFYVESGAGSGSLSVNFGTITTTVASINGGVTQQNLKIVQPSIFTSYVLYAGA
jgi:microcystin-dependent protein